MRNTIISHLIHRRHLVNAKLISDAIRTMMWNLRFDVNKEILTDLYREEIYKIVEAGEFSGEVVLANRLIDELKAKMDSVGAMFKTGLIVNQYRSSSKLGIFKSRIRNRQIFNGDGDGI